jgi:peptide/nickel transport system substrate-binding protein
MPYGNAPRTNHATRRRVLSLLGAGTAGALAGCSGSSGGESTETTTESGGTEAYVSASSVDAESLNWLTIADSTSGGFIATCLDGAWAIDTNQEIFPLWCDVSTEDAQVYEISLRENLQWGAGYGQMTAEDWVYMIREVFQAEENWSGYPNADDWFRGGEPIPVERTGELTFEIRLPEVDPDFPYKPVMWGQNCAPKGILEKYVPEQDGEGLRQDEELNTLAYAGNLGPYTYEEWQRDSQFVAVRNDDYYLADVGDLDERWNDVPNFGRNVARVIKEESTRLGALESGSVTSAGIPPGKAERFERMDDVNVTVSPQPFVSVLAYNQRANGWTPFRRESVRQALAHAVNKEAIADTIYRGYAQVAQTMQPKWSKWYSDDEITNYGVGDRYGEMTRDLLADALSDTEYGYDGETLVDGDGEPVSLTLFFDQGQETERTVAEFIAQEYGTNAGIDVQVKATSSFISKYATARPPDGTEVEWQAGQFNGGPRDVATSQEAWDMSVNLGFNTYPYTPTSSRGFFDKRGPVNYYGYYPNNDIAGLYEEASSTVDEEERIDVLGEAFGYINEEQPFGFLVMTSEIVGYQSNLRGPVEEFENGWDSQTWYFES